MISEGSKKKMKKANILTLIAAAATLTGCTINNATPNKEFTETGVVTKEDQKQNVRKIYKKSVDNVEDLETIDSDDTDETTTDETPVEDETPTEEDTPVEDDTKEESDDTTDTDEDEDDSEDIKSQVSSYHVDYTYEYALKATYAGFPLFDEGEKETYSLTYVKENEDIFLDLTMSHSYKLNSNYSGEESVHAIFQDNTLYLESSVSYGEEVYTTKEAYAIRRHHVYGEFGDFFRYTYLDLLFADNSKENSYSALDALLEAEGVEITDATDNTVSIKFSYDELDATIVFNTELQSVVSATFDSSAYLNNLLNKIVVRDNHDDHHGHEGKDFPEEDKDETSETTEVTDESSETTEETTEVVEENPFKVEEAKQVMTVNFSYNDQVANKLSEEEIAEYHVHQHGHYDHYNDHSYYGEEKGNHKHDSEGWDHSFDENEYDNHGWDFDDSDDYDSDSWWDDDNVGYDGYNK